MKQRQAYELCQDISQLANHPSPTLTASHVVHLSITSHHNHGKSLQKQGSPSVSESGQPEDRFITPQLIHRICRHGF